MAHEEHQKLGIFLTNYHIIHDARPTANIAETSKHGGCLIALEQSLPQTEMNLDGRERFQESLLIVKQEQKTPLYNTKQEGSTYKLSTPVTN